MRCLILLTAGIALIASPAVAQMNMNMPGMKMSAPKKKAPAKKNPAKKTSPKAKGKSSASTKAKAPTSKASKKKPAAHSQGVSSMPGMKMPPGGSTKSMPSMSMPQGQTMQNMPDMQKAQGQTMPGMQMAPGQSMQGMSAMSALEPPVGPAPAAALRGPENAADTVYGKAAMEPSRTFLMNKEHGGMTAAKLLVDQLETRVRKGRDGYFVNAQGWYGGDIDKLWLKTEIEGTYGSKAERAEFQALWSHAIDPWWDLQGGVRLDVALKTRARLALGVQGLAPYWIETEATAFVSTKGDVTARLDVNHDVRIRQKLILQPRAELNFALQDIPSEQTGSGLSTAELGLRLRYALVPNFAPYIGVGYNRAIGNTKRFRRLNGEEADGFEFLAGLRTWF